MGWNRRGSEWETPVAITPQGSEVECEEVGWGLEAPNSGGGPLSTSAVCSLLSIDLPGLILLITLEITLPGLPPASSLSCTAARSIDAPLVSQRLLAPPSPRPTFTAPCFSSSILSTNLALRSSHFLVSAATARIVRSSATACTLSCSCSCLLRQLSISSCSCSYLSRRLSISCSCLLRQLSISSFSCSCLSSRLSISYSCLLRQLSISPALSL